MTNSYEVKNKKKSFFFFGKCFEPFAVLEIVFLPFSFTSDSLPELKILGQNLFKSGSEDMALLS